MRGVRTVRRGQENMTDEFEPTAIHDLGGSR
jgi:hypothetical protein